MRNRLARLLRPRSIAVVGGREARRMIGQLARIGFDGAVWPVHPTRATMGGHPVFRDVESLPAAPDAAFVAVNRERTVGVVSALAARGAGGAVCYASGFLETRARSGDGARLQAALLAAAGDLPVVGPNCYGIINYADRSLLWPDQYGGRPLAAGERGVALVSQSSNLVINLDVQQRGLPVAYVMTVGNQAQTGLSDLAAAVLDDPRVSAIGCYVEGFDDVGKLEALATKARVLGKPLIMVKSGRSALGGAAAFTHTAAMVGEDAVAQALLVRLGIARVDGIEALLEALKLVHVHGPLRGFDVASLSCSGGEAALMADGAHGTRLRFPPLDDEARARVEAALGPRVHVANPLDYHTYVWGDAARLEAAFTAMLGNGFDLTMLILDLPRADRCDPRDWWTALDAFSRAATATGQPSAVIASLAENLPESAARTLIARGIAPLVGIDHALEAVEAAARIGEAWSRPLPLPLLGVTRGEVTTRALDEHAAKEKLAGAGLPIPPGRRVDSVAGAMEAARAVGTPVAVKALGIDHKTEANAVRLDVSGAQAVEAAASALLGLSGALLVEGMVPDPVAEVLVGVRRVPGFGLALSVASGGVLAELTADSETLLLPCTEDELRAALERLRVWSIVRGHRGRVPADGDAIVAGVLALARFAETHIATIEEVEVNPLIACRAGQGVFVADAMMRLRKE